MDPSHGAAVGRWGEEAGGARAGTCAQSEAREHEAQQGHATRWRHEATTGTPSPWGHSLNASADASKQAKQGPGPLSKEENETHPVTHRWHT